MRVFDYNVLFDQLIQDSVDPVTGEIINPDFEAQLAALEMSRDEKAEQVALAYKNCIAEIETLEKVIDQLQMKVAIKKRSKNFFHDWLDAQVTDKLKTALVSIYHSRTKKTELTDESAIPDEYIKVTKTVQKEAIKKAIQSGVDVPGAKLVDSKYIVIR